MPAGASGLVAAVAEAAPRVGLLLGLTLGRVLPTQTTGVHRVALVEVATPGGVWAPLACGLPDPGLLLVPSSSVVAFADLALGGPGSAQERPPTALEQALLLQHLVPALRPLADALSDHGVTSLTARQVSDKPLPVGGGEVVAIGLELHLPVGGTAPLTVCLPAKSLLPTDIDLVAPVPDVATRQVLADVHVEVALRLSASTSSADVVEDLHPGDVIRLDAAALNSLVGVRPGQDMDVPVLTASLGRRGRLRAIVVSSPYGGQ
jgi:flagellar motor switch protein FliM